MALNARQRWIVAAVWLAVFVVTMFLLLGRTVNVRDEAWMLWLATRLARGDVVYRDAYDVTTPVAAWLAAAVVSVTGTQMWALRALAAAIFATEVLVGISVVRRCGTRVGGQTVLVLALLAVAAPFAAFVSLYSALAILGGLCTLRATLWWLDGLARPDGAGGSAAPPSGGWAPWAAWVVGAAVGLTFWTKPNVGVLVALAVAVAVVAAGSGGDRAGVGAGAVRMLGGATVVSVLVAGVLVTTGAWSAFVDQVFLSKGEYFDVGFGYLPALADRLDVIVGGRRPFEVRRVLAVAVQAAPLVLLPVLAVGVVRARRTPRGPLAALAAFAVAGLLAVLPRPGLNHITGVMPLVLPAIVGTWALALGERPEPARRVRPMLVIAGALAVVGLVSVAIPLVASRRPERFDRHAEHFTGTPVSRGQLRAARRLGDGLRERGIDSVFIAREDAGFLYLRTGTTNPLPYDMVERSDLGGADERGVIRRIAAGEVAWVCLHGPRPPGRADDPLVPRMLERWVRANLEPVAELPRCDLYRATAGRLTGPRA